MIKAFCNLAAFRLSIGFTFSTDSVADAVLAAVSGKISGIRLPAYEISPIARHDIAAQLTVDVVLAGRSVSARFGGDIVTPELVGDIDTLHWDFWKVSIAALSRALLAKGIVIFHAACVDKGGRLYLLPGSSGAGKSALSFFARSRGAAILASELCFVAGGHLVSGNSLMSIDPEALVALNIPRLGDEDELEGKCVCQTEPLRRQRRIDRVIFPKISAAGNYAARSISDRRSRMILFENAIGQLAVSQLIHQQRVPVGVLPTQIEIDSIAAEVDVLSRVPALICEGPPAKIWANM